jgi:DNA mismatch repair ATPase MutL
MKLSTLTGTSTLLLGFLLTVGFAAPSYAQDQQEDKPKQQPAKPQDAKPEHEGQPKQQAAPPKTPNEQPRPDKEKEAGPPKQEPQAEQPKTEKQSRQVEKQNEQQQQEQEKTQKDQQKQYGQQRQYTQQQRGEQPRGGGGRIPDDRYRAHFGREHHFHVGHPQIVEGQPHFEYAGYSFIIVQAWPADWGYDDDVYIVDDDGVYYLCDLAHPGAQLELNVIL